MKLLLTSKGIVNTKIEQVFINSVTKPLGELSVCIIPTAAKALKSDHPRILQAKDIFLKLGIQKIDSLDVEVEDAETLKNYDVIYLGGGDPVHLLAHLKRSGAETVFKELTETDAVIVGVSAGSLVLGPHLHIVKWFTPDLIRQQDSDLNGFRLFDFPIMPHADREDVFPSHQSISDRLGDYQQKHEEFVYPIHDDDVLLIENGNVLLI